MRDSRIFIKQLSTGDIIANVISESWYHEVYDGSVNYHREDPNERTLIEINEDTNLIRNDVFIVYIPTWGDILEYAMLDLNMSFKTIVANFNLFLQITNKTYLDKFSSREELALAFYYSKVHGKVWEPTLSTWIIPQEVVHEDHSKLLFHFTRMISEAF